MRDMNNNRWFYTFIFDVIQNIYFYTSSQLLSVVKTSIVVNKHILIRTRFINNKIIDFCKSHTPFYTHSYFTTAHRLYSLVFFYSSHICFLNSNRWFEGRRLTFESRETSRVDCVEWVPHLMITSICLIFVWCGFLGSTCECHRTSKLFIAQTISVHSFIVENASIID